MALLVNIIKTRTAEFCAGMWRIVECCGFFDCTNIKSLLYRQGRDTAVVVSCDFPVSKTEYKLDSLQVCCNMSIKSIRYNLLFTSLQHFSR